LAIKKQATAIICLSPYSGGMEIDAIKLAKKLSNNIDITVIAQEDKFIANQKNDYVGYNGITLETIKFSSSFSFSIIFTVRSIVQKKNIKNVIFFGASELKSLYFSFLGLDINLIIRHGTTKSRPKKDWFHKLIYSKVNYHVSICKHLLNNVRYIIPFGENTKEKLIYSSFEVSEVSQINHEKIKLLHIGRIAEGKGQVDAIKSCQILVDNNIDFEFNIVGGLDESYELEFMEFFNQCNYKDKINLVGFTDNVKYYIQNSDIFLFPSYGEGLSNAFLEAVSNNIIAISYDNTSFPELQELGLYFHMVIDRNIDQLQEVLLECVKNLSQEKEKSSINNKIVEEKFSLKEELDKYLEILK
jgi:glycosyltransferase involved in cell wall biosynthesis